MPDASDMDLVRDYARHQSEAAFAELARRHVNLVYSVALRFTRNPPDAEEVAQAVFVILARKAGSLAKGWRRRLVAGLNPLGGGGAAATSLTGWLYETTRFTALRRLRDQARRRSREQEAHMQSTLENSSNDAVWRQVEPLLEQAMSRLNEKERTLLALRFYENRSSAEAAALLGIGEWAARKRASRALEKLRGHFARHGVDSTTTAIAESMSAHSMLVAPAGLAAAVTASAKGAAISTSTLTLVKGAMKIMAWTKMKTAIVAGAVILLAAGTATVTVKMIRVGEPSYHGKTLTALMEESKDYVYIKATDTPAERERKDAALRATYEAVQHIGTPAIPILLQWVANTTNGGGNILAVGCIQKLGPNAKATAPGLIKILNSDNEMARYSALNALQRIGPAANQALPAILDHVRHDPADWLRSFSVTTLANNGIGRQNPKEVVPVLIECLDPTNKAINRAETLRALAGLGTDARPAEPAILPYLKDTDSSVRLAARNALQQIDPAAANAM